MGDNDRILVYTSDKSLHIDIIKDILTENNIESYSVDKMDSAYIVLGEIELYVDVKDAPLAKIIIEQNPL